jgi:ribosome-binding factor A
MKPKRTRSAEPSQRQLRVGEQIRHILAETMQRGHFRHEALLNSSNITVTEVRISPDLKNATAYVMTLGGAGIEDVLPALNESSSYFQKEIGGQGNLKFTPKIHFKFDDTFDQVQRIDELLRDIAPKDE